MCSYKNSYLMDQQLIKANKNFDNFYENIPQEICRKELEKVILLGVNVSSIRKKKS